MGRLILVMGATLSGCCEHTQMIADEEYHKYTVDLMEQSDALLFGRKIYQLMEGAWPEIEKSGIGTDFEVDFAHKISQKPKYVISRTLDHVSWQNSFLLKGSVLDEIIKLKEEGKTLLVNGGPGLGSELAEIGLVDEYHILIQPVIFSCSSKLLGGVSDRIDLKLAETKVFESGVVALKYLPVR